MEGQEVGSSEGASALLDEAMMFGAEWMDTKHYSL